MTRPNQVLFTFRMSLALRDKLNDIARDRGITVRQLLAQQLVGLTGIDDNKNETFRTYTRKPKTKQKETR